MEVEHHTYLSSFHSASVSFLQSSRLTCCPGSRICFSIKRNANLHLQAPPFSFNVPSSVYNYDRRKSAWNALQWSRKSSMNNDNSKRYKYLSWLLHPGSSLPKSISPLNCGNTKSKKQQYQELKKPPKPPQMSFFHHNTVENVLPRHIRNSLTRTISKAPSPQPHPSS
jgi:hypothetical protein